MSLVQGVNALKVKLLVMFYSKSSVGVLVRSDGVLIFDEVKVACQLMWNLRSHQLMGLAMTHKVIDY